MGSKQNLVLDADVAVACVTCRECEPRGEEAKQALERAREAGWRVWIAATSLPVLLHEVRAFFEGAAAAPGAALEEGPAEAARKAVLAFLERIEVLTSHGFQAHAALEAPSPAIALTAAAAEVLGDDVVILSRNPDLLRDDQRARSPEAFLAEQPWRAAPGKPTAFVDLARQQQRILPTLERNIHRVFRHGKYILGPEIRELEERLAAQVGTRHALTCASGTDALLMALMALDVGPGDAVFTSPFTFVATAEVISLLGATPVFVDIDPVTFNLDPVALAEAVDAVRQRTSSSHPLPIEARSPGGGLTPRVVIPVDLFGLPADYDAIRAVAGTQGLTVVEDAAQSFGASFRGRPACSLGEMGCTSFFPAKPLGCYGDGGAVFTDDTALAEKLESIRVHGKGSDKYDNVRVGLNARMDTLQAAILLPKLEILPGEIEARDRVAGRYTERLASAGTIRTPRVPEGLVSAWAQYSPLSDHRDAVLAALRAGGIPSAVYYPKPLHLQTAYTAYGYREGDFPVTESASARIFSVPMHPYLEDAQVDEVARVVAEAVARGEA